jgi:DNA-binding PucR family transcriptional regulator
MPFLEVIQDEVAPGLVWERYAALNILFPVEKDCTDIKQYTLDAARRIRTALQACLPELQFSIGIGNFYKDVLDVHRSYQEAREALDTGRRLGGGDGLHHYLDIGIVQMLARMGQQGPIRAFVNNTIGRLLDYDRNRKGQFLPTLEMILTGKSLRIISEEMNVHQKTIVFRKMRIEEILNLPIDEGDVRLNLSIALKLHKLTQSIEAEKQTEPAEKKKRKRRRRKGDSAEVESTSGGSDLQ